MNRTELLNAFEPHRRKVLNIETALAQGINPKHINGYITKGSTCYVFRMGGLVAKLPTVPNLQREGTPVQAMDESIDALLIGHGDKGLEQIAAYSPIAPLAFLCRYIEGQDVSRMPMQKKNDIPQAHFEGLITTFRVMQRRKLATQIGDNTRHNARGLFVLDYEKNDGNHQTLEDKILMFAREDLLPFEVPRNIPPVVATYRAAAVKQVGRAVGNMLDELWLPPEN